MSSHGRFPLGSRTHERLSIQHGRWARRGLNIGAHLHVRNGSSGSCHWTDDDGVGRAVWVRVIEVTVRVGAQHATARLYYVGRERRRYDMRSPRQKQIDSALAERRRLEAGRAERSAVRL